MDVWPLGHLEQWYLVLWLMFRVLATAPASIQVICVLVLALNPNLTIAVDPVGCVAFAINSCPDFHDADLAIQTNDDELAECFNVESCVFQCVNCAFHDFSLSFHCVLTS